jgi:3-dehydroquinate synthase
MEKVIVVAKDKTYEIAIESGLFKELPAIFRRDCFGRKLAIVTDSNVYPLYGKEFSDKLKEEGLDVFPIVFEAGEQSKNLNTLESIYNKLADSGFTRSDAIVALGGGVVGDMAGLAAATFLRGIGYIQIPTTLLAMVDSSLGGKVAVDMPQGKNLIGAFYQPDAVYTDPMLLETLSDRQFSNGMAELLKHGFIRDADLYNELVNSDFDRNSISFNMDMFICSSCIIKRTIVEEDEFDNGVRQVLNFGHTIGHAIERVQNYSGLFHGEAVSVGMVLITKMTERMGLTRKGESEKIKDALRKYNLPVTLPGIDKEELIRAISLDKKNRSGKITIAYIEEIGEGRLLEMKLEELENKVYEILED